MFISNLLDFPWSKKICYKQQQKKYQINFQQLAIHQMHKITERVHQCIYLEYQLHSSFFFYFVVHTHFPMQSTDIKMHAFLLLLFSLLFFPFFRFFNSFLKQQKKSKRKATTTNMLKKILSGLVLFVNIVHIMYHTYIYIQYYTIDKHYVYTYSSFCCCCCAVKNRGRYTEQNRARTESKAYIQHLQMITFCVLILLLLYPFGFFLAGFISISNFIRFFFCPQ